MSLSALRRNWPVVVIGLLVLILLVALGSRGSGDDPPAPAATPSLSGSGSATGPAPTSSGPGSSGSTDRPDPTTSAADRLPTVPVTALPPQARRTLDLIAAGGPFPYDRDGTVFSNRERLLPIRPRGFYREYTVVTPGENDRGARRIVAARDGTRYYTDDHYRSFRRVLL